MGLLAAVAQSTTTTTALAARDPSDVRAGSQPLPDPSAVAGAEAAQNQATQSSADTAGSGLSRWVGDAVNSAMDSLLDALSISNSATGLQQGWFGSQYELMLSMGVWIVLPLVICSVIQGVARSSMEQVVKSVVFYPILAIAGSVVAVELVRMLVVITDQVSELFNSSARAQINMFFNLVRAGFDPTAAQQAQSPTNTPASGIYIDPAQDEMVGRTIFIILIGVGILLGAMMTIVILAIRDASIYIATLFLPVGFAMLVWPSTTRWFKKLFEFLLAMILSKLVMVATLSLGVSAAMAAMAPGNQTADPTTDLNGTALVASAQTVGGPDDTFAWLYLSLFALTILIFAVYSPAATSKMVSLALNDGAAGFAAFSGRPSFVAWIAGYQRFRGFPKSFDKTREAKAQRKANQRAGAAMSLNGERMLDAGVGSKDATGAYNFNLTRDEIDNAVNNGFTDTATGWRDATQARDDIWAMSTSSDAGERMMAFRALEAYKRGDTNVTISRSNGVIVSDRTTVDGKGNVSYSTNAEVLVSPADASGNSRTSLPMSDIAPNIAVAQSIMNARGATGADSHIEVRGGLNPGQRENDRRIARTVDRAVATAQANDIAAGRARTVKHVKPT